MDEARIDEVLGGEVARKLLMRPLARLAYVARDGTPRAIPIGYVWNGSAIISVGNGASTAGHCPAHVQNLARLQQSRFPEQPSRG